MKCQDDPTKDWGTEAHKDAFAVGFCTAILFMIVLGVIYL